MGLDTVEFIMGVEETFGVSIDGHEAEQITNMGGLHRYVSERLRESGRLLPGPDPCASAVTFYRLRRHALTVLQTDRRALRPDTELQALLGTGRTLRKNWRCWSKLTGAPFPALKRPLLVSWAGALVVLAIFVTAHFARLPLNMLNRDGIFGLLLIIGYSLPRTLGAALLAIIMGLTIYFLTEPLACRLPVKGYRARDLVRDFIARNPRTVHGWTGDRWTTSQVWDWLCILLNNQTGVRKEQVSPDATFRELGMD